MHGTTVATAERLQQSLATLKYAMGASSADGKPPLHAASM